MPQLSTDRYAAEIEASTAGLAEIVAEHDQSLPIPTCPEWTLRQLVTHVGRAHRWAAEITRTRSEVFIPFREVPDGKLPDDRLAQGAWLQAGAARIVGAVREAGSDLVWSFTGPAPAGFWIRRMAHETLVHTADAQLAAGAEPEPVIEAEIAADAIDEWLMLLTGGIAGNAGGRVKALPAGARLHIHATDDGLADRGEWMIRHDAGGLTVEPGHGKGDAALTGPAASLLLVLMRRRPLSDPAVTVYGDSAVVDGWLASTAF
ncbi:MAG TPA: maleylpyruvate isomerase family mycothiol-dependent enzyme [Streptosporangiaceae bacterium]|nr:maleylpyruvate isomerase family mycothiol-dependent enzyme [Streptosporangiaceae bacterium]